MFLSGEWECWTADKAKPQPHIHAILNANKYVVTDEFDFELKTCFNSKAIEISVYVLVFFFFFGNSNIRIKPFSVNLSVEKDRNANVSISSSYLLLKRAFICIWNVNNVFFYFREEQKQKITKINALKCFMRTFEHCANVIMSHITAYLRLVGCLFSLLLSKCTKSSGLYSQNRTVLSTLLLLEQFESIEKPWSHHQFMYSLKYNHNTWYYTIQCTLYSIPAIRNLVDFHFEWKQRNFCWGSSMTAFKSTYEHFYLYFEFLLFDGNQSRKGNRK